MPDPKWDEYHEDLVIRVRVEMVKDGRKTWRAPSAAALRRQIDQTLEGTGMRRTGRRYQLPDHNGWLYLYTITRGA